MITYGLFLILIALACGQNVGDHNEGINRMWHAINTDNNNTCASLEELSAIFQNYDTNNDKRVTVKEFVLKWSKNTRMTPCVSRRLYRLVGSLSKTNTDMAITLDDAAVLYHISDKDDNKCVTKSEFRMQWTSTLTTVGLSCVFGGYSVQLENMWTGVNKNNDTCGTAQELRDVFLTFDIDGSKGVSAKEFVDRWSKATGMNTCYTKMVFAMTASLTQDEKPEVTKKEVTSHDVDVLFSHFDQDSDKCVTENEFIVRWIHLFAVMNQKCTSGLIG